MLKIGAHQSIVGGFSRALERVTAIGGNCLQIFSSSPRDFKLPAVSSGEKEQFRAKKSELGIDPVYFHAPYLVNLADKGEIGRLSREVLIADSRLAYELGIRGEVVHLGSFRDAGGDPGRRSYERLVGNIVEVLEAVPETLFIIENAGTHKIGTDLSEIGRIIKEVASPRVRVCLDTCHLHAAGYDLATRGKLDMFLDRVDELFGLALVELFHVNDSKDGFGSFRDRHENIGQGEVGPETFRLLLTHPRLLDLPFIIETPGFADQGPDKENIDILKGLAEGV